VSNFSVQIQALIDVKSLQEQLSALSGKLKLNLPSFSASFKEMEQSANGAVSKIQQVFSVGADGARELTKQTETLNSSFGKTTQVVSTLNKETGSLDTTTIRTTNDIAKQVEKAEDNSRALRTLQLVLSGLTDEQKKKIDVENRLKTITQLGTENINKQGKEIRALQNDAKAASRGMNTFAATLEYTTQRFIEIGLVMAVIRKIKQAISDMISNVTNLDSALVELKKVTNLTGGQLETFTNRAFKLGESIARTGTEVIEAAAIFARSGYEIEEALDLSETALIMMNVGDGIDDVSTAATSLISVLKGFNMEASQAAEVVDLVNQVSNTSAINFEDLTEGLTRVSATFNQAGVSIEETSALLTGANEILQSIEKTSSGLIVISQRLRGISTDSDETVASTSKLSEAFKRIANIDIFDQETGQLRDTYSILEDMAAIWPTLTANQKQYLGELAAGEQNCPNIQKCILRMTLIAWNALRDKLLQRTHEIWCSVNVLKNVCIGQSAAKIRIG